MLNSCNAFLLQTASTHVHPKVIQAAKLIGEHYCFQEISLVDSLRSIFSQQHSNLSGPKELSRFSAQLNTGKILQ